jgi:CelD/BcsL family acetyltransferase involved in cellulose biosynthesis
MLTEEARSPKMGLGDGLCVHVVRKWDDLKKFSSAWESLLTEIPEASIFLTPEWLGSWWRAFGRNKDLVGLVFLDPQQETLAIALLYLEHGGIFPFRFHNLRIVGAGSGDSDALDFIVKPGAEPLVAAAFSCWLAKNTDWAVCSLETLPKNSRIGHYLQQLVETSRWRILTEDSTNYVIDLPATWQAYLQGLDPKFRPLLTRYPKRLQTRYPGVRISRCENTEELSSGLKTLFELHQMRWTRRGEPGAFSSLERRNFYSQMAEAFLRRGWLEFWRLELENKIVAAQFCFRYRDTVYVLQEGFDPKYADDKIGYALRARVLQEMIQTGARRYDFLGGDDQYKLKFGARQGGYTDLHFAGASFLGRFHLMQRQRSKQARRWVRIHLLQPLRTLVERPPEARKTPEVPVGTPPISS